MVNFSRLDQLTKETFTKALDDLARLERMKGHDATETIVLRQQLKKVISDEGERPWSANAQMAELAARGMGASETGRKLEMGVSDFGTRALAAHPGKEENELREHLADPQFGWQPTPESLKNHGDWYRQNHDAYSRGHLVLHVPKDFGQEGSPPTFVKFLRVPGSPRKWG